MSNSYKEPFTQITEDQLIKTFEEVFRNAEHVLYYYTDNNVEMVMIDGAYMKASDFDKAMKEVLESDYLEKC